MTGRKPRAEYEMGLPPSPPYCKLVVDVENPCASLCTNQSRNLLAVVGRKVFKILKLFPDKIECAMNLRDLPHKQVNLKFSSNDVQWNPNEDCQLATAPTNGSVVLWNIEKRTKSKLDHAFDDCHQRAVNKLSFHQREPNLLLSGSQDNTMKMFDTRNHDCVGSYKGPDSVRDVKFPAQVSNDNHFAACYDNGVLHIWDRRHGEHPVKQQACHNGPVYCCEWHLEKENCILTAGRDKMIKGYGIEARMREIFSISTRVSVARAKWRPGHRNQVTSCSHFLDTTVLLWDNRRPFIPFASFSEHSDDVTDFLWLREDVLLTCSKDGKLVQQLFSDAQRPIEKASPVGLSFRPDGSLAHACSENLARRSKSNHQNSASRPSQYPMSFRKSESEPYLHSFLRFASSLKEHGENNDRPDSFKNVFETCATSYKLHGQPLHELCDHNHSVAKELGLDHASQTWLMLKLLYCGEDQECSRMGLIDFAPSSSSSTRAVCSSRLSNNQSATPSMLVETASDVHPPTQGTDAAVPSIDTRPPTGMREAPPSSTVDSAHEENNEEETDENAGRDVDAALDFFESADQDLDLMEASPHPVTAGSWAEMQLPTADSLQHDLALRPPTPDHMETASGISTAHSGVESTSSAKPLLQESMNFKLSSSAHMVRSKPPQWDFSRVVTEMLEFYAEQGDVQMSISCLLVLGERGKDLVGAKSMEHWFSSYIDLLSRYKLWTVAAQVIKLCSLPVINEISQQSTTYHTGCGNCNKLMESVSWQCKRCAKIASVCAVCHGSVKGLFAWCQVCGHGGHLQHIQEWHRNHAQCPTGCGHNCFTGF